VTCFHLICWISLNSEEIKSEQQTKIETKAIEKEMTPRKLVEPAIKLKEEEWQKKLTPEQYAVTRQQGTERAFGAAYHEFEQQGKGAYHCVCCGVELFTSNEKFHSGCGWPSFYDASTAKNVLERHDVSHGMIRTEVVCKRCHAHLGHVFEGESISAATPTKRRFCINAAALKYVKEGEKAPALLEPNSEEVENKKKEVKE
jgi:peptide-methionine (R)-S-oxide reductase